MGGKRELPAYFFWVFSLEKDLIMRREIGIMEGQNEREEFLDKTSKKMDSGDDDYCGGDDSGRRRGGSGGEFWSTYFTY